MAEPPQIHDDPGTRTRSSSRPWREARALRYGSAELPRRSRLPWRRRAQRRAVVTIVHNEPVFLPIWLRFYSRFFAADDIYVLDNDTTDGSTDGAGSSGSRSPTTGSTTTWMVETLAEFQRELLERYDVVLVSDVDEIVAPDPGMGHARRLHRPASTRSSSTRSATRSCTCPTASRRSTSARPVLDQRGYWFANDGYDKPVLATVPMTWVAGLPRERRRPPQLRSRPAPDPPAPHGLRALPRPARRRAPRGAGTTRDVDAGWARLQPARRRARSSSAGSSSETGFESEGIEIVLERDPASVAGPVLSRARAGSPARVARRADRAAFPPAARRAEHWQRVVMNEAVEA